MCMEQGFSEVEIFRGCDLDVVIGSGYEFHGMAEEFYKSYVICEYKILRLSKEGCFFIEGGFDDLGGVHFPETRTV